MDMNRDLLAMQLFEQASQLVGRKLSEFLDRECNDDAELRVYVESLLQNLAQTDGFLDRDPIVNVPPSSSPHHANLSAIVAADSLFSSGAVLNQRYTIVEKIGEGGMGSVYRATDLRLDREVAIKALNRAGPVDSEMQRRFEREIKSVAALSHPHIVTLYDLDSYQAVPLAIMEYVAGKTLRELTSDGMSLRAVLSIVRDVAAGLDAAHERGVMHRDIKPENVIVTASGTAKLLDFGLARQEILPDGQSLTATHQAPGTPPYMSPEQVLAKDVGCPTDVFSLGTVLFEMLAGKNPFRGKSALETMQRISQQAVPGIADFVDSLPEGLVELLTEMLQWQAEKRPSAREVVNRLSEVLSLSNIDQQLDVAATIKHNSTLLKNESLTPPTIEPPTNLPLGSVRLTGRDEALANIKQHLSGHSVVTVLGTGGVGKTSVAYEAARMARGRFPGGVWLCELAPLRNQDGVLEVLSGVLDGNAGAVNKLEEVIARLQGLPTLLLFDNCEHVVDAAAELVEHLSRQLPNLSLLATSREALQIAGERVIRLEGLSPADAAALFTQRASEHAGFCEDSQSDDLVKQIVAQLEGLPLAIELAAPKLAVMSLSELLEALDDQTSTLRSGRRSHDRQSTINDAIAWSFELLEPEEQQVLLALSVFAAWFTSEAAIEVCGLGPTAKIPLLRLVEQSVVVRKEDRGKSRYRLLEPIRQFCQAKIERDALTAARQRHAYFYANRAAVLGRGVSGFDEIECHHALNAEWSDLREAVAWGREQQIAEVAIDPVVALHNTAVWHLRLEIFQWLITAEQQFGEEIVNRADVYGILASGYWLMGKLDVAENYLQRAYERAVTPLIVWKEFIIRGGQANFSKAAQLWQQFQELAEASGDEVDRRWAGCAYAAHLPIMIDPSDPCINEIVTSVKQRLSHLDWPTGEAMLHGTLANLAMMRSDRTSALKHRQQAIDIARRCGNRFVEYFAKALVDDAAHDTPSDRRERLATSVASLQSLLDAEGQLYVPMTVRSVILAMIAVGELETAVRCSAIVESLQGLGDNDEYSHEYQPALEEVRDKLGQERFNQLREAGQSFTPTQIVEFGTQIVESLGAEVNDA